MICFFSALVALDLERDKLQTNYTIKSDTEINNIQFFFHIYIYVK